MADDGEAVNAEIAEIETTMATDRRAYDNDSAMQGRLRDLYQAQESGTSAPKPDANAALPAPVMVMTRTESSSAACATAT